MDSLGAKSYDAAASYLGPSVVMLGNKHLNNVAT